MAGIVDIDPVSQINVEGFLANISAAAFLVDRNGLVIYANDSLAHLTGMRLQQIIGQS
jgi:PAS domain-containing protein